MEDQFIRVSGEDLVIDEEKVRLRGFGIGSWMNLEHFMTGIPGNDHQIKKLFAEVYGRERAREFFNTYLSAFITEADFKFLHELGVNSIRLAFSYRHFEDDQYPGEYKEEGFHHLDRVLELCQKYRIYAILDLHTVPGGQNPDFHADIDWGVPLFWEHGCLRSRIIHLWKYIADHYKNNPWVAAYDLINEPVCVPNAKVFNDFYDRTIDSIRQVDNNHLVFIEGDSWTQDFSKLYLPRDPQIAYSFHFYPFYSIPSADNISRKDIETALLPLINRIRKRFDRPLWCGETGIRFRDGNIDAVTKALEHTLDILEESNISWTIWAYKDVRTMGLLYPKDETPWMKLVKKIDWFYLKDWEIAVEVNNLMHNQFGFSDIPSVLQTMLLFRFQGILKSLHLEQKVKPVLKTIPWEEIRDYPNSFHWDNCRHYPEIANLVKSYTIN